jgi:predicted enzyme related to lactoylglutathione lyase
MRFRGPVLDTGAHDAVTTAQFYAALLGWSITHQEVSETESWALVQSPSRELKIELQGTPDYQRPVWPNQAERQQMMVHLDIAVDDVEAAVARAVELGATEAHHQPRQGQRVLLDPSGHPFCLYPDAVA